MKKIILNALLKSLSNTYQKTIEKTCDYINEAAKNGADLVMFPEAYLPGYPSWCGD